MSKTYFNGLHLRTIEVDATEEEFENLLSELTDEDFNGNNGEEYYIKTETGSLSKLDYIMAKFDDYSDKVLFLKDAFEYFFKNDWYYDNHEVKTLVLNGVIIIAVASTYSN